MRNLRWLAALPFLGILVGPFFLNRVEPFVFGLPLLLAWLVFCVIGTSAVMGLIYLTAPQNRAPEDPR
ncbi:permease [Methylobacterium radiotolerans]|nr:permease [Methylobacterium radiotolerans]KTS49016.1 permease [Methylobacterium radiotolerans]